MNSSKFFKLSNLLGLTLLTSYTYLFLKDISPFWKSKDWITDDVMQQAYQFHQVFKPGLFANDIITDSMTAYLAPLHYWLCYFITWLCGDVVIMTHWVMGIQIFLTAAFIFLTINHCVGIFPASLGALWFLHSGILIQRLAGGLPRGWVAPLIAAYLYYASKKNHAAVLITLLTACFLNSLAAFLLITSYGLYLCINLMRKNQRPLLYRPFINFLILCPVFYAATLYVTKRPEHIGKMVTYEEALNMPALSSKKGRFKIAPIPPAAQEFRNQSFQIFSVDYHKVLRKYKRYVPQITLSLIVLFCLVGLIRKINPANSVILSFAAAIIICYFLSRLLAFNLYVPNRYIRFPVSIFFICFFSIAAWKVFHVNKEKILDTSLKKAKYSYLALIFIALFVYLGSGSGLQKNHGYNYRRGQDGHSFAWLKKYTPEGSVVAGYPNFVDPVPFFAKRKVYISNETAHPFYDNYYKTVAHRVKVSFKAHYAKDLRDMAKVLKGENIDYFVFERRRFYPDALKKTSYFAPFDKLAKELTRGSYKRYAYRQLPEKVDPEKHPYMAFKDAKSVVIDVNKLKERYLPNG